jgi:hypothetical protein
MRIKPNLRKPANTVSKKLLEGLAAEAPQTKAEPPKPKKAEQPNPPKMKHSCGHGPNLGVPCTQCTLRSGREYRKKKFRQVCGQLGRLPHKSVFRLEYNADREEWEGTLVVNGTSCEGKSASVHHLLRVLGAPHIKAQEGGNNGEAEEESGNEAQANGSEQRQSA